MNIIIIFLLKTLVVIIDKYQYTDINTYIHTLKLFAEYYQCYQFDSIRFNRSIRVSIISIECWH